MLASDLAARWRSGSPAAPRGVALATVLGVLFLTFLDTTIVSVTLGDQQKQFATHTVDAQASVPSSRAVLGAATAVPSSISCSALPLATIGYTFSLASHRQSSTQGPG